MTKKILIYSTIENDNTSILFSNYLCSINYTNLNLDKLEIRSPLRILETTINNQQIEFWNLIELNKTNRRLIGNLNFDALILISTDEILNFLNSNSNLFKEKRNLPILWLTKQQIDSTLLSNVHLQSNYNIKQVNCFNSLEQINLEAIEMEFNNWINNYLF